MNANELILDYVAMCEKFGALDFSDFIDGWLGADAIAQTLYLDISHDARKALEELRAVPSKPARQVKPKRSTC